MQISLTQAKLSGNINIPTSKSIGHRIMICRYLASGIISSEGLSLSKDINATAQALAGIAKGRCHCGESGSTLRFLLPVALAKGGSFTFSGEGRLMQRPMEQYERIFTQKGISWQSGEVLNVSGKLTAGEYLLDGNVSSQYITGLLLALPILEQDSTIIINTTLESASYVNITLDIQKRFGVCCKKIDNGFFIKGGQKYKDAVVLPEPDLSQAAFWLVANKLGSNVNLDLPTKTLQGDGVIIDILNNNIVDIDITDCPDLAPVLAVWLSQTGGWLRNCQRLKYKESNRLNAICKMLASLGGSFTVTDNHLQIHKSKLNGGIVDSFNDHRIAMAAAIAATVATGTVTVTNGECVEKSYPDFWKHYISVGGKVSECDFRQ